MNTIETLAEYGLTPESYEVLLKDCGDKVDKVSDLDWAEISEKYSLGWNGDTCRKAQQPPLLGGAFVARYFKEKYANGNKFDDDAYIKELQIAKRELEKERKKIQTEKLELNKYLREDARDEMILENICNAISKLQPLDVPERKRAVTSKKSYLLAFGDCHDGIEFCIKDLFGSIINEYSPEIFEKRMWDLLDQVIEIINKEGIEELAVWELSDSLQGILRLNSQLMKLRLGICDATMHYAQFLSVWLTELSKYVHVKFQMNKTGNHDQLRICDAPKNAFDEENMGRIIWWYLKEALKNNPNITMLEYGGGLNWGVFSTYAVASIHGEVKNLSNAINEIGRAQQTHLDYLIGGHCHHSNSKETGIRSEVLSIRSIIGVDPYGMSLNKTSDAGASLFTFDQFKGLVREDKIKLN